MPQYFIEDSQIKNNFYQIRGEDFHHLQKVRKAKVQDEILLRGESGNLYQSKIVNIEKDYIRVKIFEINEFNFDNYRVNLYQALLKVKKNDFIIQKTTELGVDSITHFFSERTIPSKIKPERLIRWKKIAKEASKQSLRKRIPEIREIDTYENLINKSYSGIKLLADPGGEIPFKSFFNNNCSLSIDHVKEINVLIGPEGGFSPVEIQTAEDNGWAIVNFGKNQLKAETAAIVIPGIIIYEWSSL